MIYDFNAKNTNMCFITVLLLRQFIIGVAVFQFKQLRNTQKIRGVVKFLVETKTLLTTVNFHKLRHAVSACLWKGTRRIMKSVGSNFILVSDEVNETFARALKSDELEKLTTDYLGKPF